MRASIGRFGVTVVEDFAIGKVGGGYRRGYEQRREEPAPVGREGGAEAGHRQDQQRPAAQAAGPVREPEGQGSGGPSHASRAVKTSSGKPHRT